jgi:hypothetical protein
MIPSDETMAYRHEYAAETRRLLAAAIDACGPGADDYCVWWVHDRLGREPMREFFGCRRDGEGWHPKAQNLDERIESDVVEYLIRGVKGVSRSAVVHGVKYYPLRYQVHFSGIAEYKPRTKEQLEAAEAHRVAKRAAYEAELASRPVPQLELPGINAASDGSCTEGAASPLSVLRPTMPQVPRLRHHDPQGVHFIDDPMVRSATERGPR